MVLKIFLGIIFTVVFSIQAASSDNITLDTQITPEVTSQIAVAIAGKSPGFMLTLHISGKAWNIFKLEDPTITSGSDLSAEARTPISIELARIQHDSNLRNGNHTILIRQLVGNRHIFRVIRFEVDTGHIAHFEEVALIEFCQHDTTSKERVHLSTEHVHQFRVHESLEHVHQARIHESDAHLHMTPSLDLEQRIHMGITGHIHQARVHEFPEHLHQARVHDAEHLHDALRTHDLLSNHVPSPLASPPAFYGNLLSLDRTHSNEHIHERVHVSEQVHH